MKNKSATPMKKGGENVVRGTKSPQSQPHTQRVWCGSANAVCSSQVFPQVSLKYIRNGGNQLCGSIIYAQGLSELALAQAQASVGGGSRRIGRRDVDTDDPHELTVRLCVDLHGE